MEKQLPEDNRPKTGNIYADKVVCASFSWVDKLCRLVSLLDLQELINRSPRVCLIYTRPLAHTSINNRLQVRHLFSGNYEKICDCVSKLMVLSECDCFV